MDSGIYSIKWFLQCYLGAIPFSLTLRVWDAFLLEGDPVIPAMAFNILKLNQKSILKMDMDQINELLQKTLPSDFGFEEDTVIESLKDCLAELKSSKLLWTDPIPESERPKIRFGAFCLDDYEIETMLESGARSAVNEDDRKFHRNTLQREQDNILNLRHIDSQDSIDDVDEESEASLDKSLSLEEGLSDESLERDDATPTEEKLKNATDLLATSLQKLDKSLEFLMSQANISDQSKGRQRDKVKQISFVEPAEVNSLIASYIFFSKSIFPGGGESPAGQCGSSVLQGPGEGAQPGGGEEAEERPHPRGAGPDPADRQPPEAVCLRAQADPSPLQREAGRHRGQTRQHPQQLLILP